MCLPHSGLNLRINMRKDIRASDIYGGNEVVDKVETIAIERALKLFDLAPDSGGSQAGPMACECPGAFWFSGKSCGVYRTRSNGR